MNERPRAEFGREVPSCASCRSTVRTRAIAAMLARELFGFDLALPDFPVLKGIRGVGISDSFDYSGRLAARFDYRNTEYDRAPQLDIVHPDPRECGVYDFIVCSEVLEHVVAPVETAFSNLSRLLAPAGVLLMTVPYKPEGSTIEHFGPMQDFAVTQLAGKPVLVRPTPAGGYEVFDNLVFHGGSGSTLEMRVFSEQDLRAIILGAGFSSLEIYSGDVPAFGVLHNESWSLPMAARKAPFAMTPAALRSWAEQWANLSGELNTARAGLAELAQARVSLSELDGARAQLTEIRRSWWYRVGRKLGFLS
jgi:SAM-dependent methyltransferase